jgi:hypothetical protein
MVPDVGVKRLSLPPLPPDPDLTVYFEAGVVRIGVEYRELSPEITKQIFKDDPDLELRLQLVKPVDDNGVSLHVFGAEDDREYLRFDCFAEDPHYHYLLTDSDAPNVIVQYDSTAGGEMLPWAIERRGRLPEMLAETGAAALAGRVDPATVAAVLPRVIEAAQVASRNAVPAQP